MAVSLAEYLLQTPLQDGIYQISPPRPFQHPEEQYDQHRPPEKNRLQFVRQKGAMLLSFFHRQGLRPGAPILEIGCGTGWGAMSLALQPDAGHLLITDPSPAFCGIARQRLSHIPIGAARLDFGLLRAEEVDRLPSGSVSLIYLRSVLHHVLDVDAFLSRCAQTLPPGGLLICEEPYYEGYLIMGFLCQFIADALRKAGAAPSPEEQAHIDLFIATMQYYCRRDVDKTEAEDKHLFRPDELFASGRAVGLDLTHYPNWHATDSAEDNLCNRIGYFERFFFNYLRVCMNWPPDFVDRVAAATRRFFAYFQPLESLENTVPHLFGTFVFTKRQ